MIAFTILLVVVEFTTAFLLVMITCSAQACEEFLANQLDLYFRVVGECKVSRFQAEEDARGTLA